MPDNEIIDHKKDEQASVDSNSVILEFNLHVDRDNYERTNFGEPPQLAIWIEHPETKVIKTVWVSHRAGQKDWKGKVDCPVAIPYWTSRHRYEKSGFKERNIVKRLIDAVTGATPTGGKFSTITHIPKYSRWDYYIEVNISGDYNTHFPYWSAKGIPDDEGNGQPSIIYKGEILAETGRKGRPVFYGRSEQRQVTEELTKNLAGLTTALEIVDSITVYVH